MQTRLTLKLLSLSTIAVFWKLLSINQNLAHIFPDPERIIMTLVTKTTNHDFLLQTLYTLKVYVVGLLTAIFFGIFIGLLASYNRKIRKITTEGQNIFRSVPSVAILPLLVFFFGLAEISKVIVVFYGSIWPIMINTSYGVLSIEKEMIETAKTFLLSKEEMLLEVIFPASLGHVLTGIKISSGVALAITIGSEMLLGVRGIGFIIQSAQLSADYSLMYAGILWAGIIGFLLNSGIEYFERKMIG
jgi:ABC-type nitrate/sulfonate/bicarbonate transport system permease component